MADEPTPQGWQSAETARRYGDHVRRFPAHYEVPARHLLEVAGIRPGMSVIDLACGTGVLTAALLERLGPAGRVVAVDQSPAMLDVARAQLPGAPVQWVCAPAESLSAAVTGPFDAVLCSAAFWQLRMGEALGAVHSVLAPDGVFAFNLPSDFFPALFAPAPPRRRPTLRQRMVAVAVLDHDFVPERPRPRRDPFDNGQGLEAFLAWGGFALEERRDVSVTVDTQTESDWFSVPVFTERLFGHYDIATRLDILRKATEGYAPDPETETWASFRCRSAQAPLPGEELAP